MIKIGVLVFLLCAACIQDVRSWKISNLLVSLVAICGIYLQVSEKGAIGVMHYALVFGVYLAAMFPLYLLGMLGAGDVKMMAALEGCFGWQEGMIYLLCVLVVAGGIAMVRLLLERNLLERLAYFASYARDVMMTGQWKLYLDDQKEAAVSGRYLHMSIPMLAGLLIYMGGRC